MRTRVPDTGERWRDVDRLLDLALDHDPDERSAFLDRECAGDAAVRAAVDRLLRACDDSAGFLEDESAPAFAAPVVAASLAADRRTDSRPAEGLRVGPYRVVREAGHGGMGVVYLAERADDQYRRRVALKLMRGGAAAMADDHLARRFLRGASDPRVARAPGHRAPARRRRDRRRPPLVRDGVRRGHARSTATATTHGLTHRRAAHALLRRVPRGRVRAPEPRGASRPQAIEHPRHRAARGEAARLRHRQAPRAHGERCRRRPGDADRGARVDAASTRARNRSAATASRRPATSTRSASFSTSC